MQHQKPTAKLLVIALTALFVMHNNPSVAQMEDWRDMKCLSRDQQAQILTSSQELLVQFKLELLISDFRAASEAMAGLKAAAQKCKSRMDNPLEILGAITDGCIQATNQYNDSIREYNRTQNILSTTQTLILTQLSIVRMKYPSCQR